MSIILSKTDFLIYHECPKNAWLKLHKPKVYYSNELSEFEKTIIETGNEVESVARKIFPSGVLIKGRDKEDLVKTLKLVAQKSETIFQAVFVKDQLFAATDILQFDQKSKKWLLIEVKASNSVKDKIHLYDLAFQTILLKKIGLELESVNILHLNPKYIRTLLLLPAPPRTTPKSNPSTIPPMTAPLGPPSTRSTLAGPRPPTSPSPPNSCPPGFSKSKPGPGTPLATTAQVAP